MEQGSEQPLRNPAANPRTDVFLIFRTCFGILSKLKQFLYLQSEKMKYQTGEMAEWLNAAVLKTVKDASPSGVRIPVSPQTKNAPFSERGFLFSERQEYIIVS